MARDKALLVGFRPSNFTQAVLQNDRLVFWHKTDPSAERKTSIPQDVRVVIMTKKFCGKSRCDKIASMIEPGVTLVAHLLGTGQVRKYLEEEGFILAEVDDTPPEQVDPKPRRGTMSVGEMYERLVPVALQLPPVELPQEDPSAGIVLESTVEPTPVEETIIETPIAPTQNLIECTPAPTTTNTDVKSDFQEAADFVGLAVQELLVAYKTVVDENTELKHRIEQFGAKSQKQMDDAAANLIKISVELDMLRNIKKLYDNQSKEIVKLRTVKAMSDTDREDLESLRRAMATLKSRQVLILNGNQIVARSESEAKNLENELKQIGVTAPPSYG